MSNIKYDWILFDADNTLFDFDIASKKSFRDLMIHLDIEYTYNLYDVYHEINLEIWHLFEQDKIDALELRSLRFSNFFEHIGHYSDPIKANAFYLDHLVVHSTIYNTTYSMLDKLKGSVQMAIITNGLKEVQRPRIRKLNLESYFDAIIVSDEIGYSKPNTKYFDVVFNKINHPDKDRVLVVGDSLRSDIQGGNKYNLDTCWYNPEKNKNLTKFNPTFEINSHVEIFNYL